MQNLDKNCRVCMEWQEHCYWSHMADEEKHFFKILAGDFTESISIPSRFANNFNGHISEVVTLKSPSGKIWSIGVCSDNDEVVFRFGWKEFVSAHSIEEGDYLLFKYTGVSAFDVLIFDSSGCEKTSSHFSINRGRERIKGSAMIEEVRHGCHRLNGIIDCLLQSLPSDDDDQAQCEVKDEPELDADYVPAKTRRYYYFSKNGPVSEYHLSKKEREEISSIRVPVRSRNPVFVQVMHASHVRSKKPSVVGLPSEFAMKYIGTLRRRIILERVSGRGAVQALYHSYKSSGGLGRGWCRFVKDNGILKHDVCLFELMQNVPRLTMTVHVLRKVRGRFVLLR